MRGTRRREDPDQPPLFEAPRQIGRRRSAEDDAVYDAVRILRSAGAAVYAAGLEHSVDGNLLSSAQLVEAAAAVKAEEEKRLLAQQIRQQQSSPAKPPKAAAQKPEARFEDLFRRQADC